MMKIQRFVLSCAVALAAFGAGVGLLEIVGWLGAFSEPLNVKIVTPVFTLPPKVEFKPAGFVSTPTVEPAEEDDYEWSGGGDYYVAGKNPEGFEEIASLSILTHVWDGENRLSVPVKPSGELYATNGSQPVTYKFSDLNMTGKRVSIVTRAVKGVSYQFDGKFIEEQGNYTDGGTESDTNVVLKGRLTKWRNGKMIAEAKVKFEMGGC